MACTPLSLLAAVGAYDKDLRRVFQVSSLHGAAFLETLGGDTSRCRHICSELQNQGKGHMAQSWGSLVLEGTPNKMFDEQAFLRCLKGLV